MGFLGNGRDHLRNIARLTGDRVAQHQCCDPLLTKHLRASCETLTRSSNEMRLTTLENQLPWLRGFLILIS